MLQVILFKNTEHFNCISYLAYLVSAAKSALLDRFYFKDILFLQYLSLAKMGGKVWSDEEEQVFWEFIIPQSPCAADPEARHLDWRTCADLMTVRMGEGARRTYTHTMLCK